jgi:hypothetical protein
MMRIVGQSEERISAGISYCAIGLVSMFVRELEAKV